MKHFNYNTQNLKIGSSIDACFEKDDFASFHDAIIDASDKHLNQKELAEVWNILPDEIKFIAIEFGMSDTVFADKVYVWAEENIDKLQKYTTWKD